VVTGLGLEVVKICVLECEICNSLRGENHRRLIQGCTDLGRHVVMATDVFAVAPNICGPSVRGLLRATILAPRIMRQLLDFYKMCGPSVSVYQ
jgi:hypothetical protein